MEVIGSGIVCADSGIGSGVAGSGIASGGGTKGATGCTACSRASPSQGQR